MMMSIPPSALRPPATMISKTDSVQVLMGRERRSIRPSSGPGGSHRPGPRRECRDDHEGRRGAVEGDDVVEVLAIDGESGERRHGSRSGSRRRTRAAEDGRSSGRREWRPRWRDLPGGRTSRGSCPTAYIRSSKSTVRGKKSIPSRMVLLAVAVTSISVSPMRATTAPSACRASLPVENERVLPPTGPLTVISGTRVLLSCWEPARYQL